MDLRALAIIESLKSTALLTGDLPSATAFDRSLFGNISKDATINFDQKLGRMYEQALEVLIGASPALSLVAKHIQVFDQNKRTLGELDFILSDHTNKKHIHLELAVKFYLAHETVDGWRFSGPNANDSWRRKLNRMQHHQLALSQTLEAQILLNERFNIQEIEAQQLIYGCIFLPIDCDNPPKPEFMSANGEQGHWLYISQWNKYFGDVKDVLIIPKSLWPVELSSQTAQLLQKTPVDELMNKAHENCIMFLIEEKPIKLFLVPKKWVGCVTA